MTGPGNERAELTFLINPNRPEYETCWVCGDDHKLAACYITLSGISRIYVCRDCIQEDAKLHESIDKQLEARAASREHEAALLRSGIGHFVVPSWSELRTREEAARGRSYDPNEEILDNCPICELRGEVLSEYPDPKRLQYHCFHCHESWEVEDGVKYY